MERSDGDIQRIPWDPLRFDLLQLFAAHLAAQGGTLQDPTAQGEFVASLHQPLTHAVAGSPPGSATPRPGPSSSAA
jgi:hypothetical protein